MIEYGPDAGRTPGDAELRASLLKLINTKMERDEGEAGGPAGTLRFRYQICLLAYVTFNSSPLQFVSTIVCLLLNPLKQNIKSSFSGITKSLTFWHKICL